MTRDEVTELHFIAPIANVPPIVEHGILCHKGAVQIEHHSVAMAEIQERRTNKRIPGAGPLHDYANLYFDAHNPMLSRLRAQNDDICILCVDPTVLDLPGVIIADRNAASDWVRFSPVGRGPQSAQSRPGFRQVLDPSGKHIRGNEPQIREMRRGVDAGLHQARLIFGRLCSERDDFSEVSAIEYWIARFYQE